MCVGGYLEPCLAILGHFEGHLGLSRAILGHLGPHGSKRGGDLIRIPPSEALKRRLGAVLERSWAPLGRSWGRLGPSWAPSWGSLGATWGHLEDAKAHRKRKGENAKNIDFP